MNRLNETCAWLGEVAEVREGAQGCGWTWDARTLDVRTDFSTLGVLVLYTRGVVTDWVDLIISDLSLTSLTAHRILDLESELGARVSALEIARATYQRGHAEIPGSSSFTIIRLSSIGARRIEC
ncbi:hypothetical protein ACGFZC_16260 [[Kitasatospora] papulosa]|uniref:hypothetical protein n=1 Tax=[Kitasatospora] papulosa TaxID=1464011 RepID=UPI003710B768